MSEALQKLFAPYFENHDNGDDDEWCLKHLPSVEAVRAAFKGHEQTPCPVCPHWLEIHNPDGSCGCGMDCANYRLKNKNV